MQEALSVCIMTKTSTKFELERSPGKNNFNLWQIKYNFWLETRGMDSASEGHDKFLKIMVVEEKSDILKKVRSLLC